MPIRNSDGEIIGVAQAINKTASGELFTEDDEKVILFLNFLVKEVCLLMKFML